MFVELFRPAYQCSLRWTFIILMGVSPPSTNRTIYIKLVHIRSSQNIAFSFVGRGKFVSHVVPTICFGIVPVFVTGRNDFWAKNWHLILSFNKVTSRGSSINQHDTSTASEGNL